MTNKDFVHLHLHTAYSTFDGLSDHEKAVMYAREQGFPAMAITDHGTCGGLIKHIKLCSAVKDKKGNKINHDPIIPILGVEAYFSKDRFARSEKEQPLKKKGNHHLLILARNYTGYRNLSKLSSIAWQEGFYYKPRIDFEVLSKYHEGLLVSTACPASIFNSNILSGRVKEAKELCAIFKDIFKDNFFIELMFHGLEIEKMLIPEQLKIAKDLKIPLFASNDAHYIKKEHAKTHDVFLCMNTSTCIKDPNRMSFSYDEFYIKSAEEMASIFKNVPSAISNTVEISKRIDVNDINKNLFGKFHLPDVPIPEGFKKLSEYFESLVWNGAKKFGWDKDKRYIDRINAELIDIKSALEIDGYDFYKYFLIIRNIIEQSKKEGITVGPGRGSVYASAVARCLGITSGNLDIIDNDLIWERFLAFKDAIFFLDSDFGFENASDVSKHISSLEDDRDEEIPEGEEEEEE